MLLTSDLFGRIIPLPAVDYLQGTQIFHQKIYKALKQDLFNIHHISGILEISKF